MQCVTRIKQARKSLPSVSSQKNKYLKNTFLFHGEGELARVPQDIRMTFSFLYFIYLLVRGRFINWVSREAYFLSHMAGLYSILSGTWVTPVLYMLRANPDQSWRARCISYLPMRQPQNQLVFQGKMANLVQNGVWKVLPWVVKKKHKPAVLERLLCDEHGALSQDCRPALKETLVCGTYNTPWLKNDDN